MVAWAAGEWWHVAGQRKATSFDIAHLAGVSQPTVSRALRGSPTVSPATRQRIEAIAKQLNYTVDRAASGLRSGQTRTLALLLFRDPSPDDTLINPFFLAMLGSMMSACAEAGYDLLVSFQQPSSDWQTDYEKSHRADGLILLGYGDYADYRQRLVDMVDRGTHFVRWGHVQAGQPGLTIGCDNVAGGRSAAEHLVAQGRRRIAFLGDATDHYPEFHDRYRGYVAALEAAGLAIEPRLQVPAISTEEAGTRAAEDLLDRGDPFDAIVAASDLIALAAMRVLVNVGLRVPEDVAIVGFDDIPAASLANPPLTTVVQDAGAAGRRLIDTLLARIRGEPTQSVVLPTRLVVRRSSV
ncbi:DNA-binding LacI/PurR family transcriptional regulator [Sphingomonas abaci]|uniref:DNA-binding LacI/PurR family transcriptional regulator n=1 Tax=Sphingomonas abaci TaxID=237611 RepID=A0A7W7AKJ3_9SPHN|nr:LacI family DNA-binding transcriptional regulator [Sphingomonas abaci]MBB4618728.1 DNA-binding LacI/PurR family transcriptional regulator [Sphingomonas abaci]